MDGSDAACVTLEAKIEALIQLRGFAIGETYIAAVDRIEQAARCIVTGMGKSGIVARKVAATFQSTGQSAVFLDPAAAAHGDMGMIEPSDVILMISNSGETDELREVATFASLRANVIILVTSRPSSSLAPVASHVLVTPSGPEGDPIDRVPMASIICQLAIGDMLAASLMARRGFTEAQFLALHHGGYLGRRIRAVA